MVFGNDRRGAALRWPIVALRKQQRTAQNRLIVRRKQHRLVVQGMIGNAYRTHIKPTASAL
jgi:hypothetical protein